MNHQSLKCGFFVLGLVVAAVQWRLQAVQLFRSDLDTPVDADVPTKTMHVRTTTSPNRPPPPAPQNFSSFDWRDPDRFRYYKPDLICSGCYQHAFEEKTEIKHSNGSVTILKIRRTCGEFIRNETQRIVQQTGGASTVAHRTATIQAAATIAQKYPDECLQCDSKSCSVNEKTYLRFDDAAPTILKSWVRPISKLLPHDMVFPKAGVPNPKAFFANPKHQYTETKNYYWEYNPSMVAVKGHEHLIPEGVISGGQAPTYISTHRMSVIPMTFKLDQLNIGAFTHDWTRFEHINFSFLSHDMKVIQEGIFNIGYADYRLFILNEQLYLGMYNRLYPLWIVAATFNLRQKSATTGHSVRIVRDHYHPDTAPFELHIAEQHLCCANGCKGKNFNYFTTHNGKIWAQVSPAGPLEVQRIVTCTAKYWEHEWTQAPTDETTLYRQESVPTMSFGTIDEPYMASLGAFFNHQLSPHRGTACCIRMRHKVHDLLVGISHRRDSGWYVWKARPLQYTSNFYATLAEPPFTLVAMSGTFCMPHPNPEDEAVNHWVPLTRRHNYTFGGIQYYKCPLITFLQTMVENPDNPDTVIIGYGINDLVNRFVEVSKANILQMLFDPYATMRPIH